MRNSVSRKTSCIYELAATYHTLSCLSMKLEFLDDITDNGKHPYADPDKLIRIFSFDQSEAEELINVIQYWILNKDEPIDISALSFVQPINCSLLFEVSPNDIGIDLVSDFRFVCRLSIDGYKRMIGYMSAFIDQKSEMNGYNWLYDPSLEKVDLLFSPGGTW